MDLYDLQAKISADTSAHDRALDVSTEKARVLASEYKRTESQINSSASRMAASLSPFAKATADIERMKLGNSIADYDKFANALQNNSKSAVKAADDFLRLLGPMKGTAAEAEHVASGGNKIAEAFRVVSSSSVVMEGAMGGVSSRLRALGTDASEVGALVGSSLTNPLELAAIAAVGLTVASGAVVAGLYELDSSAAEETNRLKSLRDETGLSTDELQALQKAASVTGVSFENVTAATGLLEKKLTDAAANGTSKLSEGLRTLKIDTSSADTAINQVIELFGQLPDSVLRSGLAMEVWGRGGKQMLAVIDEMKGNAHAYTEEMRRMGEIIDTDDITAARNFTREQVNLGIQFDVIKDKIAQSGFPIVESWLRDISVWLVKNQGEIMAWGHAFIAMADAAAAELTLVKNAVEAIPLVWTTRLVIEKVFGGSESTGAGTLTASDLAKGTGIRPTLGGAGGNLLSLLNPTAAPMPTGGYSAGPPRKRSLRRSLICSPAAKTRLAVVAVGEAAMPQSKPYR
ncbi:MAG: hypothetical protein QOF72_1580 [Blastocatellia bacterium]|jgi:hypothetical protein|nr:hypothetical protein [Blastocatellia bacterium]